MPRGNAEINRSESHAVAFLKALGRLAPNLIERIKPDRMQTR